MNHIARWILGAALAAALAACGGGAGPLDSTVAAAPPAVPAASAPQTEPTPFVAPLFDRVEPMTPVAPATAEVTPQRRRSSSPTPVPYRIELAALPVTTGLAQRRGRPGQGAPRQIGQARDIAQTSSARGTARLLAWVATPQGGKVAAISLKTQQAVGVRLGVLVRRMPAQAVLRFYAPSAADVHEVSGREVLATITRNTDTGDTSDAAHTYWGPHIEGEEAVFEVELPPGVASEALEISLPRLSHLHDSPVGQAQAGIPLVGEAASCELDVNCYSATAESNATARMSFVDSTGGSFLCSGTLLNDRAGSGIPYFLSANHCISKQSSASSLETYWFYRSTGCNSGRLATSYQTLRGGATLLYASSSTDSSFMRLSGTPPAGTTYAGWSPNAVSLSTAITAVHHPRGDLQKISFGSVSTYQDCRVTSPSSSEFTCSGASQSSGEFLGILFSSGTTESGSSGSAIFQTIGSTRYVVGQLYGGSSSCSNRSGSNYYGRFDVAYNTALHQWLDGGTSFALTVSKAGNGAGVVTSAPTGISCGSVCSSPYAQGTNVTLTAQPSAGSTFAGWSGACSGLGACAVSMSAAKNVVATFSIPVLSLATALDNANLTWSSGGNAPFQAQTSDWQFGGSAARTGAIGNNQSSSLSTVVTGPGVISFDWKVSSEVDYDFFTVYLDNVRQYYWSGQTAWYNSSITIPAGNHTVKWEYVKDSALTSGSDAGWVDHVVFTGSGLSDANRVFNWAERAYAVYFAGTSVAGTYLGYTYRYYPQTGNYLAVNNGRVIVHNGRNWIFLDVGPLSSFFAIAVGAGY